MDAQDTLDKAYAMKGRGNLEEAIPLFIQAMEKASESSLPSLHREAAQGLKDAWGEYQQDVERRLDDATRQFN